MTQELAIIAGAGGALGPALAKALDMAGYATVGISRNHPGESFRDFVPADLSNTQNTESAFKSTINRYGSPRVLIYNAHHFLIQPFGDTSPEEFEAVWRTDTLGAFVAAKAVVPAMIETGGTILFSGATASIRGSAHFSAFASAKFALRGLAQTLAREFGPQGVHVAHIVIDGLINGGHAQQLFNVPESECIPPDALAREYLKLIAQPKGAWTHEIDIRPAAGKF